MCILCYDFSSRLNPIIIKIVRSELLIYLLSLLNRCLFETQYGLNSSANPVLATDSQLRTFVLLDRLIYTRWQTKQMDFVPNSSKAFEGLG
jgi:hypothetical protein